MIRNLQTEISIPALKRGLTYKSRIMMLGSCFCDEVGALIKSHGFNAMVNPFGTLYNPASICQSLERLSEKRLFSDKDVVCRDGIYTSFYHHSGISSRSLDGFVAKANEAAEAAADFLESATDIVITLGTAITYRHKKTDLIVSNCHKFPSSEFEERMLGLEECVVFLKRAVAAARKHGPKRFIFTVSPIRHIRDGLHSNQLSKSVLLLAVDAVCRETEDCHYFPAYEIMLDELRDYRFYAEDMCHPSRQSVNYIWERFAEHAVDPGMRTAIAKIEKLAKAAAHRPMFPDSDTYKVFKDRVLKDISEFRAEWPDAVLPEFPSK